MDQIAQLFNFQDLTGTFSVTDVVLSLEEAQGIDFSGLERSINAHISNLRAKIEPDPGQPRYIGTVFGVGYRFRPD